MSDTSMTRGESILRQVADNIPDMDFEVLINGGSEELLDEMVRQQIGDSDDRAAAIEYWRAKAHAAVDAKAERYRQL